MARKSNFFKRRTVNIDITHICALQCPRCQRQLWFRDHSKKVRGEPLTLNDFDKVAKHFTRYIDFEGTLSDPVHHPKFIDFLKICYDKKIFTEIHNASSTKSREWYIKSFKANPQAKWMFSIDGLPKDSHKYRINQDGEKLFNIMVEGTKYLEITPIWQYIVFSYNEHTIEEAKALANKHGIDFYLMQSSRWLGYDDPYIPSEKYRLNPK